MKKIWATTVFPLVAVFLLLPFIAGAAERDDPGSKDHPLISRMPNVYIDSYVEKEFDRYNFAGKDGKQTPVEGHIYTINYCMKRGAQAPSELQIIRNHTNAIKKTGGVVVYEDATKADMKIEKGSMVTWMRVQPWNQGDCYTLVIVEKEAMVQKVVADASLMADSIGQTGKVAVYEIYFDFNKADIKPESEPALREIAKLLSEKQTMKLYVVGHTDNAGGFDYNMKLSQARAEAVVQALVAKHGADRTCLKATGAGPLSPVASNNTEDGKAKNRRVELVEQ